jgi:hypothetical protein
MTDLASIFPFSIGFTSRWPRRSGSSWTPCFWPAPLFPCPWWNGRRTRTSFRPLNAASASAIPTIGCSANGVAHPLLSMRTGGYFPGLVTSLLVGVIGILLLRRLALITEPRTT